MIIGGESRNGWENDENLVKSSILENHEYSWDLGILNKFMAKGSQSNQFEELGICGLKDLIKYYGGGDDLRPSDMER